MNCCTSLEATTKKSTDEYCTVNSPLVTKSGLPVSQYGLGGAARSTQPQSLPLRYLDQINHINIKSDDDATSSAVAPFYFYYNPHRYPAFMAGIQDCLKHLLSDNRQKKMAHEIISKRSDVFIASGGTDRSEKEMEQRLSDALSYSGNEYLDLFVLEYICPNEIKTDDDNLLCHSSSLYKALQIADEWKNNGLIR